MTTYVDRVKETTTSTGTGNLTLAGAATGFQSFNTAFGTNVPFEYAIEAVDGSGSPTGDWEVGVGHLSASTTFVRDTVRYSSNSNNAVNFSAGTKNVMNVIAAFRARAINRAFNLQFGTP